ncbi:uncharacterized protein IL334_007600 [Kwoniella shivajii]|uniref:BHLH domain-containing protein n=1 Tax=Kwoniella shivajii TaxID=564305 RepID=A0ABZ1DD23_9TREE|nr:hypothetical protein IL334_007600 [Kwoniella shivajii]
MTSEHTSSNISTVTAFSISSPSIAAEGTFSSSQNQSSSLSLIPNSKSRDIPSKHDHALRDLGPRTSYYAKQPAVGTCVTKRTKRKRKPANTYIAPSKVTKSGDTSQRTLSRREEVRTADAKRHESDLVDPILDKLESQLGSNTEGLAALERVTNLLNDKFKARLRQNKILHQTTTERDSVMEENRKLRENMEFFGTNGETLLSKVGKIISNFENNHRRQSQYGEQSNDDLGGASADLKRHLDIAASLMERGPSIVEQHRTQTFPQDPERRTFAHSTFPQGAESDRNSLCPSSSFKHSQSDSSPFSGYFDGTIHDTQDDLVKKSWSPSQGSSSKYPDLIGNEKAETFGDWPDQSINLTAPSTGFVLGDVDMDVQSTK